MPEGYEEATPTSKMELFAKIFDGWKQLTIFAKKAISLGSTCASECKQLSRAAPCTWSCDTFTNFLS